MTVQKLTKEQAIILSGFTGVMHGSFRDLHADVEQRLGRLVFTHEFPQLNLKDLYRDDFMAMQPGGNS